MLQRRGEPFLTLARAIVGQQISVKAAQNIWDRVIVAAPDMTPRQLLSLERTALRSCGLSERKVDYIFDLAGHFASGHLDPSLWPGMDDETLVEELVKVRGIGRWTAEMFLIFNLLRPDVFPVGDLGLQRAISLHYCCGRKASATRLKKLGRLWAPWRSVATWYLWRSLDPLPVEY
jgi:DNA-3-methyladenine glycosylase II